MDALIVFVFCLFFLLAIRVPIFASLGLSAVILWLYAMGGFELAVFMQRMYAGLHSFTILAIPFFMLCGEIMNVGGLSNRLVVFAQDLVGWIHGGLGFAAIVAAMFIAAILGSASAATAIIGMVLISEMVARGYKKDFSAALVGAAGAIGPIIPPSIPLVVYGVIAQISVTDLFLGGYIPGIMMGGAFMIYTYLHATRYGYPAEKMATPSKLAKSFLAAFPTLLLPIIIMGGIVGGIFTPTEAGVIGTCYALLLTLTLYRKECDWRLIPGAFLKAAKTSAMVLMVMSSATLLSYVLTLLQIPQAISQGFLALTENKYVFLVIINLFFVIAGMFLDSVSGITILAPVLLPTAIALGIDPLFFGVMMTVNFSIGAITPPVGLNLYVAASISKLDILTVSKACIPFCCLIFLVIMLMLIFPQTVLFLPAVMGG